MNRTASRLGRPRRALVLLTALTAAAAVVLPTAGAHAGKPAPPPPVVITVDDLTSSVTTPDTPGAPADVVVVGEPFALDVSFSRAISETKDVTLSLSADGSSFAPGSTTSLVVGRGATGGTFGGIVLAQAANDVTLTVSATAPTREARDVQPGTSAPFDVAKDYDDYEIAAPDGGYSVSRAGVGVPCEATPERPLCSDLVLPASGSNGGVAFFSTGVCSVGDGCAGNDVLQVLAQFELSKQDPATLVVKCDKALCGGGAIKSNVLLASLAPRGAGGLLEPVPACGAKGVIDEDLESCVDYVQSKRDGSGDTYLYWLLPRDARFSI